jgi:lysozyme
VVERKVISASGLQLIKHFEGLRLAAYRDGDGWSIGYGHHHGVAQGDTCTEEDAERWLLEDVKEAESCIDYYVKGPLTQGQRDSLISFVYNLGCGRFKASTLLQLINAGKMDAAAKQFARWNKRGDAESSALTARRKAEAELFATPDELPPEAA